MEEGRKKDICNATEAGVYNYSEVITARMVNNTMNAQACIYFVDAGCCQILLHCNAAKLESRSTFFAG